MQYLEKKGVLNLWREPPQHCTDPAFDQRVPLPVHSVDVMIVDGPHGNGRSLVYPLLAERLEPDAPFKQTPL